VDVAALCLVSCVSIDVVAGLVVCEIMCEFVCEFTLGLGKHDIFGCKYLFI
jgi:hypothetical protein